MYDAISAESFSLVVDEGSYSAEVLTRLDAGRRGRRTRSIVAQLRPAVLDQCARLSLTRRPSHNALTSIVPSPSFIHQHFVVRRIIVLRNGRRVRLTVRTMTVHRVTASGQSENLFHGTQVHDLSSTLTAPLFRRFASTVATLNLQDQNKALVARI